MAVEGHNHSMWSYTDLRSKRQYREPEARQAGRYGKASFQINMTERNLVLETLHCVVASLCGMLLEDCRNQKRITISPVIHHCHLCICPSINKGQRSWRTHTSASCLRRASCPTSEEHTKRIISHTRYLP